MKTRISKDELDIIIDQEIHKLWPEKKVELSPELADAVAIFKQNQAEELKKRSRISFRSENKELRAEAEAKLRRKRMAEKL